METNHISRETTDISMPGIQESKTTSKQNGQPEIINIHSTQKQESFVQCDEIITAWNYDDINVKKD